MLVHDDSLANLERRRLGARSKSFRGGHESAARSLSRSLSVSILSFDTLWTQDGVYLEAIKGDTLDRTTYPDVITSSPKRLGRSS